MARKPDYDVVLLDTHSNRKNPSAGGAWINDGGHINIQLNPGVVLNSNPGIVISLFPRDDSRPRTESNKRAPNYSSVAPELDDDIPF